MIPLLMITLAALPLRLQAAPPALPARPNVTLQWDSAAIMGIRDAKLGTPMVARALAIVHTCMYDAWASYDEGAVGTQLSGALRRPASERTLANKEHAISYAAYHTTQRFVGAQWSQIICPDRLVETNIVGS